MLRLYLVRHGETDWNRQGRIQGQQDVGLSAVGRLQAERLAQRFATTSATRVVSSDLSRALETARRLAQPCGLAIETEPLLREMGYGIWEGRSLADLYADPAAAFAAFRLDPRRRAPGGESFSGMARRCRVALRRILGEAAETVVVTHGGPIQALVCDVLGLPLARRLHFGIDNASVTVLEADGRTVKVRLLNGRGHLEGVLASGGDAS
jgi:broad specificity phosphatase PhoE